MNTMAYILMFHLSTWSANGGMSLMAVEFSSKEKCEQAGKAAETGAMALISNRRTPWFQHLRKLKVGWVSWAGRTAVNPAQSRKTQQGSALQDTAMALGSGMSRTHASAQNAPQLSEKLNDVSTHDD